MLKYFLTLLVGMYSVSSFAQANCADAEPFCSNAGVTYPASTGAGAAPAGPNYGCLFTRPNPAWYYLNMSTSGPVTITLTNSASVDIDFIIWGPFADQASMCAGVFAGAASVDCSYSAASTEVLDIPNAQAGQWYMLMITNFSNQPTNITANQTGGSGVTNCDILCAISSLTAVPSACDPVDDSFDLSGNIAVSTAPTSGTLTVTENCSGAIQAFNAPFASNISYSFPNLTSNGANCNVTAIFSADPTCVVTTNFTAPPTCFVPDCVINSHTANVTGCDPATVTFGVSGQINFSFAPSTGQMIVQTCSGETQTFNAPFVSPINYSFPSLVPNDAPCDIDVSFTADPACIYTFTIQEPFPCSCPAEIGTYEASTNGQVGVHPHVCFGADFTIENLGGYIPPMDVSDPTIAYQPDIGYFIYTCEPTNLADPLNDPCYAGYWTAGTTATAINDGSFLAQFTGSVFTGGQFYVLPITMYNENTQDISVTNWVGDCFSVGQWFRFTLLDEIEVSLTEDCPAGEVNISAIGGGPTAGTNPYNIDAFTPSSANALANSFNAAGTGTIGGLVDGDNYSVTITDAYGCSGIAQGGPFVGPIIPVLTPATDACSLDAAFNLVATPAGGTWSGTAVNGAGLFNPQVAGVGTHTVSYLPAGCAVSQSMEVEVLYQPNATITNINPLCINDPIADLEAYDAGGQWSGLGITSGVQGTFNPQVAGVGSHTVTYTISGYCSDSDDTVIEVNGYPETNFSVDVTEGCSPLPVKFTYEGASQGVSCLYYMNDQYLVSGCGLADTILYATGCHDITLQITDIHGCVNSATIDQMICVQSPPVASYSAVLGAATVLEPTISFLNFSENATSYYWDFAGQGSTSETEPTFEFYTVDGNDFTVCLEAMNDIGCISTDCQEITIPEVFFFYVPNTFTPDGDGVNDVFKTSVQGVSGDEVYEYTFTVFNKWGEIVFKSHDPSDTWVGDKQGAEGYFIPDGIYFWQARIRFITAEAPKLYEGHLLILR